MGKTENHSIFPITGHMTGTPATSKTGNKPVAGPPAQSHADLEVTFSSNMKLFLFLFQ